MNSSRKEEREKKISSRNRRGGNTFSVSQELF